MGKRKVSQINFLFSLATAPLPKRESLHRSGNPCKVQQGLGGWEWDGGILVKKKKSRSIFPSPFSQHFTSGSNSWPKAQNVNKPYETLSNVSHLKENLGKGCWDWAMKDRCRRKTLMGQTLHLLT